MQEQDSWSLRDVFFDIISEAETISQKEMDELLDNEIKEGEEFLCDLPIDLVQVFCMGKKQLLKARQIMEDHNARHERGEIHDPEDCGIAHVQALQVVQKGKPIHEIFWALARSYAGASTECLGVRKGGVLVQLLEEEDHRDVLLIGASELGEVSMGDFFRAIFGEDPE